MKMFPSLFHALVSSDMELDGKSVYDEYSSLLFDIKISFFCT